MNMCRTYFSIVFLLFSVCISAQVVTTSPSIPVDNQQVVITFDATQGDQGLANYTGDVYAHTGVITNLSSSTSDWKYVKAAWGTNIDACKMTRIATNKYQLTIGATIRSFYGVPVGETIQKMAFVFRSSDGTKTGRATGGSDIFADVFTAGLNVNFSTPSDYFTLVKNNQNINVSVNASNNDSIVLWLDNVRLTSTVGQSLSYSLVATGTSKHMLIARAYKSPNYVADTAYYMVAATSSPTASVPSGMRDGINYNDNQSATFVLFAPYKNHVYLIGDFNNWTPDNNFLMNKDGSRYWFTINGLTSGKEYLFQYLIDDTIRVADPYCEKISDPWNDSGISSSIYPNLITYPTGKTTQIAGVIQSGQTPYNWQVTNFTPPAKDKLVVYELLIRDFTANRDIKTVKDTLQYLKRLGVNAIELMPFNEFEGNDSWGYNPSFYFAPDKAYGIKNDYKQFVDECHKNGIAVIQDLVLNHSYGQSPFLRMYFDGSKPSVENPWYNQTSNILNPSLQFGYDFNHESIYTRKLVDSIASFWMSQYKIDGFRYDFTKGFSNTPYSATSWASEYDAARIANLERMATQVWARKANAYIIFEHLSYNQEETELANFGIMLWGNMNYAYNQATMGYNDGSDFSWISYKNRGWNNPNVMAYMESHDEERLMYKNLNFGNVSGDYSIKILATALKRMEQASTFFYTVPGPKMLWQFGELGYDISINYNNDRVGKKPIHWEYYSDASRRHLYEVTKALIKLKKEEPIFSTSDFTMNTTSTYKQITLNSVDAKAVVAGNFDVTSASVTITFPSAGKWYEFFKGDSITITNTSYQATLNPGEYRLYATKKLSGFGSIPTPVVSLSKDVSVRVYPNPFNSQLFISNSDAIRSVDLCDMQGKVVLRKSGPDLNILPAENLSSGVYFLVLYGKHGEKSTIKVVKF
ncbi:MAG: alpha-amylase family glycosyl hydrolase [Bacteroidota bacterium]|nr:alpha-amylase family glycosyl hydrolase [Bacteroidota bacterium]